MSRWFVKGWDGDPCDIHVIIMMQCLDEQGPWGSSGHTLVLQQLTKCTLP